MIAAGCLAATSQTELNINNVNSENIEKENNEEVNLSNIEPDKEIQKICYSNIDFSYYNSTSKVTIIATHLSIYLHKC